MKTIRIIRKAIRIFNWKIGTKGMDNNKKIVVVLYYPIICIMWWSYYMWIDK